MEIMVHLKIWKKVQMKNGNKNQIRNGNLKIGMKFHENDENRELRYICG